MTLTELKYIVTVGKTRHFGRAAELCGISQPSLSVAIKKLEEELGLKIFERRSHEVVATDIGQTIIEQAKVVLKEAARITQLAKMQKDPLVGPLRVGIIYTISPYLLPELVRRSLARTPQMPLYVSEGYTAELLKKLKQGDIDCAIVALPVEEAGLMCCPLYDEDFMVVTPAKHRLSKREAVSASELEKEQMVILAKGNCLRDQVLEVCPETLRVESQNPDGRSHLLESTSLATIRHMVAGGLGVSIFPASAINYDFNDKLVRYIPFEEPSPKRRVVALWRASDPRAAAVINLAESARLLRLEGVEPLSLEPYPLGKN